MTSKYVPTFQALGWGFRELARHLAVLLPMSALFFAPEIFARFGATWPIWLSEIFKTALFFVLLLKAMELTKPKEEAPSRGRAQAFAAGECIKGTTEILGGMIGAIVLLAWVMFRDPHFLVSLAQGGMGLPTWMPRAEKFYAWWLTRPFWEEALTLSILCWFPLRAHVLFNFFGYIIAEQGGGAIDALRQSVHLGKNLQTQLIFFYALCAALNVVGLKIYIIGAVWTFPATVLATVAVYRSLASQNREG